MAKKNVEKVVEENENINSEEEVPVKKQENEKAVSKKAKAASEAEFETHEDALSGESDISENVASGNEKLEHKNDIAQLIEKGKAKGSLSNNDIMEALEYSDYDIEQIVHNTLF